MVFHIADNGSFACNIAVPCLECIINIILRQRTQQLMELGIGLCNRLLMQTVTELRHIRVQTDQLNIMGIQNSTTNGSIALDNCVLLIGVTAGIAIRCVLGDGIDYHRFIAFKLLTDGRFFRFSFRIHDRGICSRFSGVFGFGMSFLVLSQNGQRMRRVLVYNGIQRRDSNGMGFAELFDKLFQSVRGYTAHFYPSIFHDGSGSQREIKFSCRRLCILAIHFKEVAHLEHDNIIGMVMLDVIVGIHVFAKLHLPCLQFIILSFFFGSKVFAGTDDTVKTSNNFMPVQLHISAECFLELDTLAAIINPTASGNSMRAATGSVFILQEVHLILGAVTFSKE